MKTVLRRSTAFSTALMAAGSVVSRTWTSSAPFGAPNVWRKTSGARLLPPMRIGEQLDAIDAKVAGDLVHVDADRGKITQDLPGTLDVFEQAGTNLAVLLERHHGLLRHGVHRLGADQLLDVHHVAIGRILGSRAGPETALHRRPRRSEVGEVGAIEDPKEGLVG